MIPVSKFVDRRAKDAYLYFKIENNQLVDEHRGYYYKEEDVYKCCWPQCDAQIEDDGRLVVHHRYRCQNQRDKVSIMTHMIGVTNLKRSIPMFIFTI